MRLPIQYALAYPDRLSSSFERVDFTKYSSLTFEAPDLEKFRNLAFAYEAIKKGGNMPCILNAANEIVVAAFLQEKIGFLEMSDIIEETMQSVSHVVSPEYEDYVQTDAEARAKAVSYISCLRRG